MAKKVMAEEQEIVHAGTDQVAGAVRTCIGCRKTASRGQLIRLVRSTDSTAQAVVKVDVQARMPGRGAWLHPHLECWQLAIKRRAIGRALPGVTDVTDVQLFAHEGLLLQAR